jgi:hypothetical protein
MASFGPKVVMRIKNLLVVAAPSGTHARSVSVRQAENAGADNGIALSRQARLHSGRPLSGTANANGMVYLLRMENASLPSKPEN